MKLDGLKVLDLSSFLPGPYLTMMLADHGADVIKVEAPGGDASRRIGERINGESVFFRNVNRGKRSVALDLKRPESLERLLTLCDAADVFVESFRPGVADRLGVGYEALRARNPRLVYCSISAFGQDGPLRGRPAHDLALEAMAGVGGITIGSDGEPAMPGIPISDITSGLQGLAGVLMALLARERTGRGDRIDISMLDTMVSASVNVLGPAIAEGRQQDPRLERTTGGAAFYRYYETADGRYIALAGQEEKFVRALLGALRREDLVPPCLAGPGAHQRPVMDFLAETFATRSLGEWLAFLEPLDVCYGPVRTFPEMLANPQLAARGMVLLDDKGARHIGTPIRFTDEPGRPDLHAAALGADEVAW